MTNLGPNAGPLDQSLSASPEFLAWIQSIGAPPIEEASPEPTVEEEVFLPPPKVKEEDILALYPPMPLLNLTAFQLLSQNFSDHFGIDKASLVSTLGPNIALAQQEIVLTMLDKWVELEAKRAETTRIHMKEDDRKAQEVAHDLLKEYVADLAAKKAVLAQPALSVLVTGVVLGASATSSVSAITGVYHIASNIIATSLIRPLSGPISTELTVLTSGLLSTVAAWATPVAMTLAAQKGGLLPMRSDKQFDRDAIRAFAITLSAFLTNSSVDALFRARLEKALGSVPGGESVDRVLARIKISLLINALALLYKSEYGGMTKEELAACCDGTVSLQDNDAMTLVVKLINEQIGNIDQKERRQFLDHIMARYATAESLGTEPLIEPILAFLSMWNPDFQKSHIVPGKA